MIDQMVKVEVQTAAQDANEALDLIRSFPCETADDEAAIAGFVREFRAREKAIDEKRTKVTKPLLQAKKEVDALFAPVLEALKQAQAICRAKLADAEARRATERARALAVAVASPSVATLAAAAQETPKPAGVGYRTSWNFTVNDIDQVPREYMTIDWSKINITAQGFTGDTPPPPIPGGEWSMVKTPVVR